MTDPFEALAVPPERQEPRPSFARDLRGRLFAELRLDPTAIIPTVNLPDRRSTMPTTDTSTPTTTRGGIWAVVFYRDALAGIRFLVDVFGFEERMVVVADDGVTVAHSELRWPEGGIVQVGTFDADNPFAQNLPPGAQGLYVITADVEAVWERSRAADLEVVRPLEAPDYEPGTLGFTVRDPEGNLWSFGSYGLAAET